MRNILFSLSLEWMLRWRWMQQKSGTVFQKSRQRRWKAINLYLLIVILCIVKLLIIMLEISYKSFQNCFSDHVLKNYAKFTGKHMCWSLFVSERTPAQTFTCTFLRNFKKYLLWWVPANSCPWIFGAIWKNLKNIETWMYIFVHCNSA